MKRNILFILVLTAALFSGKTIKADGLIVIPGPHRRPPHHQMPFPLEVVFHRVEVDINGQIAETRIDQEFYNPTGRRLEGFYIFPLPPGAAFDDFSMSINGKMVSAELLDAKKARKIYEDIVRKIKDPALLEYSGRGAFKVRIFPIEPCSKKRVKISYREILKADNGMTAYTYPLNTEKFSSKPLKDVSIRVNLRAKGKIKTIFCPTHEVEMKRHGEHRAVIGFESRNIKPNIDFTLYFSTEESRVGLNILTHRLPGEDGFFFLGITPSVATEKEEIIPKDITFVIDTSGSMAGKKMSQSKKALLFCLENLNKKDRFEIIRFATEAETLFGRLQFTNPESVRRAKEFIEGLRAIGGTNIEEALTKAMDVNKGASKRPQIVVFITDGRPTIGETDEVRLIEKVKWSNILKTRIFTFGIGYEINTHLLDRITEESRAYRIYVTPEEDIELKVSGFYEKIKAPILVDLKLILGKRVKIFKTYPQQLPDLFKNSQLILFGCYAGSGKTTITLEGTAKRQKRVFRYKVNLPAKNRDNDFIASLWAAQRIGYLLDQIRFHGENKELRDEIVELARHHGIITPYTSYLIVEDEKVRNVRGELREENLTFGHIRNNYEFKSRLKDDFSSMSRKSGFDSVMASKEVAALKNVQNSMQMSQGRARLNYVDKEGRMQNLTSQVKNIQGRAIYQNGTVWIDSRIQKLEKQPVKRIQFSSAGYFSLLKKEPESAQFMALGKNVRFVLNNVIYEIFE